jgi:DNA-binding transcriptional regulator WhiA
MRTDQPHKINQEIVKKAIKDYIDNNLTAAECAVKYNMGKTTFKRYLNKFDVEKNFISPRYNYNKDYFEEIDSEEKAYWLGFIAADGSITKNGTILEISLKSSDVGHLKKFVQCINGSEDMIKYRTVSSGDGKTHEAVRILLCNYKICNDLSKYEIVPRKGATLGFPNFLNKDLLISYIRGYFDGDGSICTAGKAPSGAQRYNVSIIATEQFLIDLMSYLLPLNITIVSLEKKYLMAIWKKGGMRQIRIFLNYIYGNANIYLERKYEYYLKICRPELKSQKTQED